MLLNLGLLIMMICFGLLFATPVGGNAKRFWNRRRLSDEDVVEDRHALEKAEAELKSAPASNWVLARTFNSLDGFSEAYMIELTTKLQSEGFSVHYNSHASPGGNMKTYELLCTVEELAEVQSHLEKSITRPRFF